MRRALLVGSLLLVSCSPPNFTSEGTLTIDGANFRPQTCRVLTGSAGGIELENAMHSRLTLVAPPSQMDANEQVSAAVSPKWLNAGETKDFDACGQLLMKGESYHADGKRAVSGTISLACTGATGQLTFRGCF